MKRHYLLLSAFIAIVLAVTANLCSADGDEDGSLSAFSSGEIKVEEIKTVDTTASTTASDKTLEKAKENEDEEKEKEKEKKKDEEKDKKDEKKDSDLDETYSPAIKGTVVVGSSYLNVRTGVWGDIVGSLYTNDTVSIVGRKGDWYVAEINGERRYIHMNYVDTEKKKAGQTPVQYPWGSSSSGSTTSVNDDKIVISKEVNDACGWGSTYPNEPPATRISSPFGYRTHPVTGQTGTFHSGVDLPCVSGSRLNALANGTVERYAYDYGGGNILTIRYDNGYKSLYMHMQAMTVKIGDKVKAGQMVGKADNTGAYTTGSHLHCTIEYNGNRVDPEKVGIPLIKK